MTWLWWLAAAGAYLLVALPLGSAVGRRLKAQAEPARLDDLLNGSNK